MTLMSSCLYVNNTDTQRLDDAGSLRVVSIYGFVSCISIIMLGPVMGNWIDRSNRLTAAQVCLPQKTHSQQLKTPFWLWML